MWNTLKEINFDPEIIVLIRFPRRAVEWFPVSKIGRQGCILSHHLFSIYKYGIIREVEHDHMKEEYDEPALQGLPTRELRYADDTALLAITLKGLKILL